MLIARITHSISILSRGFALSLMAAALVSPVLCAAPDDTNQPDAGEAKAEVKEAKSLGFELGVGLGEVEQGDDRTEPMATLHLGFSTGWAGDLYYYGRKFGPVTAQTYMISAYHRWPIFGIEELTAHAGVTMINEDVKLSFKQAAAKSANKDETNYNVGGDFGVAYSLPPLLGPLWAQVAWDSHVFLAGLEGGIFLCSGRKETLTFNIGVVIP